MADPKYNKYAGTVRFDDDNIVDIDLQPDTENIRVLLNGEEVTGGSELPEVDSGDNGDVLTVVSGAWSKAAPERQVVTAIFSIENDAYVSDKTYAELYAAIAGGKYVQALLDYGDGGYAILMVTYADATSIKFSSMPYTDGTAIFSSDYELAVNGEITVTPAQYPPAT